jgi:hypothetical protein
LFTEDGVWDGGPFGRAEGREGIREFFGEVSKQVSFANHYVTNPIIETDFGGIGLRKVNVPVVPL